MYSYRITIVIVIALIIGLCLYYRKNEHMEDGYTKYANKWTMGNTLGSSGRVSSHLQCAFMCNYSDRCGGYEYDKVFGSCNFKTRVHPGQLQSHSRFDTYLKNTVKSEKN